MSFCCRLLFLYRSCGKFSRAQTCQGRRRWQGDCLVQHKSAASQYVAGNNSKGRLSIRQVAPRPRRREVSVAPLDSGAVTRISAVKPKPALQVIDHQNDAVAAASLRAARLVIRSIGLVDIDCWSMNDRARTRDEIDALVSRAYIPGVQPHVSEHRACAHLIAIGGRKYSNLCCVSI